METIFGIIEKKDKLIGSNVEYCQSIPGCHLSGKLGDILISKEIVTFSVQIGDVKIPFSTHFQSIEVVEEEEKSLTIQAINFQFFLKIFL